MWFQHNSHHWWQSFAQIQTPSSSFWLWLESKQQVGAIMRCQKFLIVLLSPVTTIVMQMLFVSLNLMQRYDCHWLWGQECSSLLLGHQFRPATKSFYRSHSQSIPCALVTSPRGHTVQRLWWWVIFQFKSTYIHLNVWGLFYLYIVHCFTYTTHFVK